MPNVEPSLGQEEMAFEQDLAKLLPQVEPVVRSLHVQAMPSLNRRIGRSMQDMQRRKPPIASVSGEGPGQHLARRKADAEACGL